LNNKMTHAPWVTMTRGAVGRHQPSLPDPRVRAGMKERNEMTIGPRSGPMLQQAVSALGRTDDPENPLRSKAVKAAPMFGTGSRTPSGPADMMPRQQAEHMIAVDTSVKFLNFALASEGPSTHERR
jgi:hypothetical protein